jgi:dTDP-4-amino-4,6-dideoxygalactose transaminase
VLWCKSALSALRVRHYCEQNVAGPSLLRFPLCIEDASARNAILAGSRDRGLGIMPSYPDSIDGIEELHGFDGDVFEEAKRLARTLVTIPVHPLVSRKDKALIVELLQEVLGERR